ncbi:MAG: UDP-N-acetylmuramate dehydrogenase [Anaerovoracaceae bacterium]
MNRVIHKLQNTISYEDLFFDENMAPYSSFRAGGKADILIIPKSKRDLIKAIQQLYNSEIDYFIMGKGSNVLVRDTGYKGAIILLSDAFAGVEIKGNEILAGSGTALSKVAQEAMKMELSGIEFASGIPGTVGGAVYMNAGAYGGEISDVLKEIKVLSADGKFEKIIPKEELELVYRNSVIQKTGDIILNAKFVLTKGEGRDISRKMQELLDRRNEKQPIQYPSAGSYFKRPEGNYAGKLIQDTGLAGLSIGEAEVSEKHCGFIINKGGASASEIIKLGETVQKLVMEKFNVWLEPEVKIIGESKK